MHAGGTGSRRMKFSPASVEKKKIPAAFVRKQARRGIAARTETTRHNTNAGFRSSNISILSISTVTTPDSDNTSVIKGSSTRTSLLLI
jgi:hypothetical protein